MSADPIAAPAAGNGTVSRQPDGPSVYVHVPFCAVRCGYCDFNTYTARELGGGGNQAEYAGNAVAEMRLQHAADQAAGVDDGPAATVFFGGGTPTLLPVGDLVAMLRGVRDTIGLAADAEVTTEANPDSIGPGGLARLADAGFTRISFGMQSAVPQVLRTLDRTHDPERIPLVVEAARDAGLEVSLDLIYGTPGESVDDFRRSIETAIGLDPDHISAYALVIEGGTKMARQLRRGEIPATDPDDQAVKYETADALLGDAGYAWYEISNFSRGGAHPCRHNIAYWRNAAWWGIGPGAHGHRGGERWWNVKHPAGYAALVASGELPRQDRELLTPEQRHLEDIMLGIRLADGFEIARLGGDYDHVVEHWVGRGALEQDAARDGLLKLTLTGRLLADAIVRDLT